MLTIPVVDPRTTWVQNVHARLPGADVSAILLELQSTVEEFCIRSLALQHDVEFTVVSGTSEYSFEEIDSVGTPEQVTWNGVRGLYAHSATFGWDGLRRHPVDGDPYLFRPQISNPTAFWVPSPQTIELFPTPPDTLDGETFFVTTSLVPIRSVDNISGGAYGGGVPDMLHDYYFEAILDGTVGRMMLHPKRPYTDVRSAEYHLRRYRNAMRTAKDETLRRWGNAERSFAYNSDWTRKPSLRAR